MRYLETIWVVALALLWAPITSHCQLEAIPALEFLACCGHEEAAVPHEDNDCEQDVCASVESGDYRTQEQEAFFVAPDFISLEVAAAVVDLASLPDEISLGIYATAPPEHHRTWHFAFRTALPVRAPSLAS